MSERAELLRKISELDFAVTDLNLYLDSHPNNKDVYAKVQSYISQSDELKQQYEEKYGPLVSTEEYKNRWKWIANPWPWDNLDEEEE